MDEEMRGMLDLLLLQCYFSTSEAMSVDLDRYYWWLSEVHIVTSQITTALISAKNNVQKLFFLFGGSKFSTLDVSYS